MFLEVMGGFNESGVFINKEGVISGEGVPRVGVGVACGGHYFSVLNVGFLLLFRSGFYSQVVD